MTEVRRGRQTPTNAFVLPYTQTKGNEAIEIYNSTNRTAQEWQELLIADILAVNEDGLWVHTKYGYSVPRRNGKNEIVVMREMWGFQKYSTLNSSLTVFVNRSQPDYSTYFYSNINRCVARCLL